jgi:hypothetical protein
LVGLASGSRTEGAYQYHGLGADAIVAVDPDVFRHELAILREIKVFLQLQGEAPRSARILGAQKQRNVAQGGNTLAVYETVVDVPAISEGH